MGVVAVTKPFNLGERFFAGFKVRSLTLIYSQEKVDSRVYYSLIAQKSSFPFYRSFTIFYAQYSLLFKKKIYFFTEMQFSDNHGVLKIEKLTSCLVLSKF